VQEGDIGRPGGQDQVGTDAATDLSLAAQHTLSGCVRSEINVLDKLMDGR